MIINASNIMIMFMQAAMLSPRPAQIKELKDSSFCVHEGQPIPKKKEPLAQEITRRIERGQKMDNDEKKRKKLDGQKVQAKKPRKEQESK